MNKQENFVQEVTISIYKTYIYSLYLLIPVVLIFGLPYAIIWGKELIEYWHLKVGFLKNNFILDILIFTSIKYLFWIIIIFILGIIIHELLHGIVWVFFTKKGFRSLSFGIMKPDFAPYIHCNEPLSINVYRLGIILPGLILGIIPLLIGIISGELKIFIFGIFFTWAASGDFIILWLPKESWKGRRI